MPANLDVDVYNADWVRLSRAAPDNSAAIRYGQLLSISQSALGGRNRCEHAFPWFRRVVVAALNEGGQPDPDHPEQSLDLIDSDLEDEFEL